MLSWAGVFLVVLFMTAIFGFSEMEAGTAAIARVTFYIYLVFFIVSLFIPSMRRPFKNLKF